MKKKKLKHHHYDFFSFQIKMSIYLRIDIFVGIYKILITIPDFYFFMPIKGFKIRLKSMESLFKGSFGTILFSFFMFLFSFLIK
jgi:hypothetical protein